MGLELLIGAGVVVVLIVAAVALSRFRGDDDAYDDAGAPGTGGSVSQTSIEIQALEKNKLAIHALLHSLSHNIEELLDGSSEYGNSLTLHRAAINKAKTMAELRKLEHVLLASIEKMETVNARYQNKVDSANARLQAQQEKLERLQEDASIDFLTKIPNRRTLDARMFEEMSRSKRYGAVFSIVVIDLDHFKQVNDVHGHLAGDRVLRALASMLADEKRASDFLGRYGGEEFVLMLPETDAEQAQSCAENIRLRVQRTKFRCEDKSIRITVSAGVGQVDPKNDTIDKLFERVDAALYRAKENGRNQVVLAPLPGQS